MAPRKTSQNRRPKGRKTAIPRKGTADRTPRESIEAAPRSPENAPTGGKHPPGKRPPAKHRTSEKNAQTKNGLWLYGIHAVTAALSNPGRKCLRLMATAGAAANLPEDSIDAEIVDRDTIDNALPYGAVHQGLALLTSNLASQTIEDIARHADSQKRTVVVVLDQVTDPQNIGATLRSAAAFGAYAVIVPDHNTPDATGAMAKAASGALETVPLIRPSNLVRALETLKSHGFWVIGLDMDAPVSLPPPRGRKILIVEDDDDVRQFPVTLLKQAGFRIYEAREATVAIELLETQGPFDLLFTDLMLPGPKNGIEIAEKARRIQPSINVLYTSGYTESTFLRNGPLQDNDILLRKPYTVNELIDSIGALLHDEL